MRWVKCCFNEARRESPGSPRCEVDGKVVGWGFNEARRESPGSRTRYRMPHHKQLRSTRCERSPNVLTASPTEPLKPDTIRYRHWSARSAGAAPATGR